jgi:hypothetical protein
MKNFLLYSVGLCLIFIGCRKSEYQPEYPLLTEYRLNTMLYPNASTFIDSKIKLVYNHSGQIAQRIGGLIGTNPNSGFSYRFYDRMADTVLYGNNTITIKKYEMPYADFQYAIPYERVLILNNGKIITEICENDPNMPKDTTHYYYNNLGQLSSIEHLFYGEIEKKSELIYNGKGNLTQIVSIYPNLNFDEYKDTILFTGYDNSPNLTKKLFIFPECFYRSLSNNNFSSYSYKKYSSDNHIVESKSSTWHFSYDSNNLLLY